MNRNFDIYNYLSITQKFIILILSANNFSPISGKLWLQKILFLISNNINELREDSDFEEDLIGPFSEVAAEEFEQLIIEDIIKSHYPYRLTNLGKKIAIDLMKYENEKNLQIINDMKEFLNDMTEDELLGFIYFSYPDMKEESVKYEQIKNKRKDIAINLFIKKKISLGKAALIAGMSQEQFITLLKNKEIKIYIE